MGERVYTVEMNCIHFQYLAIITVHQYINNNVVRTITLNITHHTGTVVTDREFT